MLIIRREEHFIKATKYYSPRFWDFYSKKSTEISDVSLMKDNELGTPFENQTYLKVPLELRCSHRYGFLIVIDYLCQGIAYFDISSGKLHMKYKLKNPILIASISQDYPHFFMLVQVVLTRTEVKFIWPRAVPLKLTCSLSTLSKNLNISGDLPVASSFLILNCLITYLNTSLTNLSTSIYIYLQISIQYSF